MITKDALSQVKNEVSKTIEAEAKFYASCHFEKAAKRINDFWEPVIESCHNGKLSMELIKAATENKDMYLIEFPESDWRQEAGYHKLNLATAACPVLIKSMPNDMSTEMKLAIQKRAKELFCAKNGKQSIWELEKLYNKHLAEFKEIMDVADYDTHHIHYRNGCISHDVCMFYVLQENNEPRALGTFAQGIGIYVD